MSRKRTRGLTLILGGIAALGAAGIDMYLPSLPTIEIELAGEPGVGQLTLSAFFVGLAAATARSAKHMALLACRMNHPTRVG